VSITHHAGIAVLWCWPFAEGTPDHPVWRAELVDVEPESADEDWQQLAAEVILARGYNLLSQKKTEHGYLLTFSDTYGGKCYALIGARKAFYDEIRKMEEQLQEALDGT
jgi:hypothetical protein